MRRRRFQVTMIADYSCFMKQRELFLSSQPQRSAKLYNLSTLSNMQNAGTKPLPPYWKVSVHSLPAKSEQLPVLRSPLHGADIPPAKPVRTPQHPLHNVPTEHTICNLRNTVPTWHDNGTHIKLMRSILQRNAMSGFTQFLQRSLLRQPKRLFRRQFKTVVNFFSNVSIIYIYRHKKAEWRKYPCTPTTRCHTNPFAIPFR